MTQCVVKGSRGEVLRSLLAETRAAPLMVEDVLGKSFSPPPHAPVVAQRLLSCLF